jgi:2-enoate reductase
MKPAYRRKKVVVVGGGLAGMEAARVAAARGHEVTLYEKEGRLGGSMALFQGMPKLHLREFTNIVDWLKRQLASIEVKVELGIEATPESIRSSEADAVIVATGSTPFRPDIPGIDGALVFTEDDYLEGNASLGPKVVVLGGHWGAETAVSLAREKAVEQVTIVEESDDVGGSLDGFRQIVTKGYVAEENIEVLTAHKALEIGKGDVGIMDRQWQVTSLPADAVIICLGRTPNKELAEELEGTVPELYTIGDCNRPNEWPILFAMEEANFVALRL